MIETDGRRGETKGNRDSWRGGRNKGIVAYLRERGREWWVRTQELPDRPKDSLDITKESLDRTKLYPRRWCH